MGNQNCKACLNKKYDIQSELINENVTDNSYRKENDNLNNINEQKYFDSNKNINELPKDNNNNQDNKENIYIEPIEKIQFKNDSNIYINEQGILKNKKYNFNNTIEENPNEYNKTNMSNLKDKIIKEKKKNYLNEEIKEEQLDTQFIKTTIISSPMRKNEEENEIEEQIDTNLIPEDDFSKYIFEQINLLRQNPKHFIKEISDNKSKIKKNKKNILIFKSTITVGLTKGEIAFDEAIKDLKNTKPMNKLIYLPELNISLPDNENDLIKKNYLKEKVNELKHNVKIHWKEIIKIPEICFLLMVVNDSKKEIAMKRKSLLDPDLKYIGICSKTIGKDFCCYLTFTNKLKKKESNLKDKID